MSNYHTKEYLATRKPLIVIRGEIYENAGGGVYLAETTGNPAVLLNTKSGWRFTAYGIGIYEDGKIDWDHSSDGLFDDAWRAMMQ